MSFFSSEKKIGILGGGQLGRMLIQAGVDFDLYFKILDPDPQAPCHALADEFVCGKLTDYQTVMEFGKDLSVLTIEIEHVNTAALFDLEKKGVQVFPQPQIIACIQDKGLQKQFYKQHHLPTADFILVENIADLKENISFFPAVQKLRKGGYDGKGVQVLNTAEELNKAFEQASVLEKKVDFIKEIAVIVARNAAGESQCFPAVEMVFHPEHNLVDYLFSPADISKDISEKAEKLAIDVANAFGLVGLLAVELFLCADGTLLINEVAPRPHNSGHQTIEGNFTSQYQQTLRSILHLPLGQTAPRGFSAMINLLGKAPFQGPVFYQGVEKTLGMEGVFLHLYGKKQTKPHRKMGHITILADDLEELKEKINALKDQIQVISIN